MIGGGIAGLTAAYRLARIHPTPKRIVLLEASSRLGGWVHSSRNADGVMYEHGPRTLRPSGTAGVITLNLVDELQIKDQILYVPGGAPAATNRLVYIDGKLVNLPFNRLVSLLFKGRAPLQRPLIAAVFQDLFTRRSKEEDESFHSFVSRRFGPDLANFIIDPMIRGICAGDAKDISVNFIAKTLREFEQKYGSVSIGIALAVIGGSLNFSGSGGQPMSELAKQAEVEKWAVWSLKGGLQCLPEALAARAAESGVEIVTESPCTGLIFQNDGTTVVQTEREEIEVSRVISALPANSLANVVSASHPNLTTMLNSIEQVTVGLVNLEWTGQRITDEAFGFLVPSTQNLPVLGVVYDTCAFPQGDRTVVTCMMGGKWYKSLFGDHTTKEDLLAVARKNIEMILGISDAPDRYQAHILEKCIPQYVVGHTSKVAKIREYIQQNRLGLDLIGASFDGVSVNDCIANALSTVDNMAQAK